MELVWQSSASWVEGVVEGVIEQTGDRRHVHVSESVESAGEVGGVVVGAEQTPKLRVEDVLRDHSATTTTTLNTTPRPYWQLYRLCSVSKYEIRNNSHPYPHKSGLFVT